MKIAVITLLLLLTGPELAHARRWCKYWEDPQRDRCTIRGSTSGGYQEDPPVDGGPIRSQGSGSRAREEFHRGSGRNGQPPPP